MKKANVLNEDQNNLVRKIIDVLNEDMDNGGDPSDHVLALSLATVGVAIQLGLSYEDFIPGLSDMYKAIHTDLSQMDGVSDLAGNAIKGVNYVNH